MNDIVYIDLFPFIEALIKKMFILSFLHENSTLYHKYAFCNCVPLIEEKATLNLKKKLTLPWSESWIIQPVDITCSFGNKQSKKTQMNMGNP